MITEAQKKYLSTLPDGRVITIEPFDSDARKSGDELVSILKNELPGQDIRFIGATALGIAGQNDIDINILVTPAEYGKYSAIIEKIVGEPKSVGSSIKWEFKRGGFDVELYLTDKHSPELQEQIRVFDILNKNIELRKGYEKIKLPYGPHDFKDYMRKKYGFFNKILS